MDAYSILTVDLNQEVSTDKRNKFYEYLQQNQWVKINQLTTLWYAKWETGLTAEGILATTKADIDAAAQRSQVSHYDVATAICGKPVVWRK